MSINSRIAEIIQVKTGSQKKFAERLGWTPQYVGKLVREGGSVGIDPVTRILEEFPDIDGRWLILGEGKMLIDTGYREVRYSLYNNIRQLLEIERYLPYMTQEELNQYKDAASGLSGISFSEKQVTRWENLYNNRAGHTDTEN